MNDSPRAPDFDPATIVELDVRDDLRARREPLPRIVAAVRALSPDGVLHVRTTFLPAPLIDMLVAQGLRYHHARYADDDWSTWFWRGELASSAREAVVHSDVAVDAPTDDVTDLRMYPPPQPLTWIMARVEIDPDAFDVLLPFFPLPLVGLLEPIGRSVTLVVESGEGVRVRIGAATPP